MRVLGHGRSLHATVSLVAPALALVVAWVVATTIGPNPSTPPDVAVYHAYAGAIRDGQLPYRDFLFEYPPLSVLPILAAGVPPGGPVAYQTTFETLMLGALLVIQWLVARMAGPRGTAVAWSIAAIPLAAGAIAAERLDLLPVAFTVAGLAVLVAGPRAPSDRRCALALGLLALGTAAKLFPLLVAAVVLAWLWGLGRRRAVRLGAGAFLAVLVVTCAPFVALSPGGFSDAVRFHAERPVQIESTPALVGRLIGGGVLTGVPERPNDFRSQALEGGPMGAVEVVFAVLELAAIVLVIGRARALAGRAPRTVALIVPSVAVVLAYVALGKVLSPQFALWVAPLAPLLWLAGARAAAALVVVALVLTQIEFPHAYRHVAEGDATGLLLLGARNGALALAMVLLLAWAPTRRPAVVGAQR